MLPPFFCGGHAVFFLEELIFRLRMDRTRTRQVTPQRKQNEAKKKKQKTKAQRRPKVKNVPRGLFHFLRCVLAETAKGRRKKAHGKARGSLGKGPRRNERPATGDGGGGGGGTEECRNSASSNSLKSAKHKNPAKEKQVRQERRPAK